jgi:hypothetical protein
MLFTSPHLSPLPTCFAITCVMFAFQDPAGPAPVYTAGCATSSGAPVTARPGTLVAAARGCPASRAARTGGTAGTPIGASAPLTTAGLAARTVSDLCLTKCWSQTVVYRTHVLQGGYYHTTIDCKVQNWTEFLSQVSNYQLL